MLAGVANTPLAASIMAIELFGASVAPYAAVSCIVSFLITGRRSIYNKQHFAFDKNMSEDYEDAQEEEQNIKQLEKTLNKKNFILASVKHLIPDIKNKDQIDEQKTNKKQKKKNIRTKQQEIQIQQKNERENKTKTKKSILSHLLFSFDENNNEDGK